MGNYPATLNKACLRWMQRRAIGILFTFFLMYLFWGTGQMLCYVQKTNDPPQPPLAGTSWFLRWHKEVERFQAKINQAIAKQYWKQTVATGCCAPVMRQRTDRVVCRRVLHAGVIRRAFIVLVHEDRRLVWGEERRRPVQVLVEMVLPLTGCLGDKTDTDTFRCLVLVSW